MEADKLDNFLIKLFPGIGGNMTKQADHYRPAPNVIYVVESSKGFRIYTAEGHAFNWFTKQAELGRNPRMIKYMPTIEEE